MIDGNRDGYGDDSLTTSRRVSAHQRVERRHRADGAGRDVKRIRPTNDDGIDETNDDRIDGRPTLLVYRNALLRGGLRAKARGYGEQQNGSEFHPSLSHVGGRGANALGFEDKQSGSSFRGCIACLGKK